MDTRPSLRVLTQYVSLGELIYNWTKAGMISSPECQALLRWYKPETLDEHFQAYQRELKEKELKNG